MTLDVPTLALLVALVVFEAAIGFILVGRMLGKQPGLGPWVLCGASMAGGALVWIFRVVLPGPALAIVGTNLQFLAYAFAWAGAREFCGRDRSMRPLWLALGAFLAVLATVSAVTPSARARVAVVAFAIGSWCVAIAWTFFRDGPVGLRSSTRIAGTAFLLHGFFHFARISFPQPGSNPSDLLRPGWPRTVSALEFMVFSVVLVLSLIALLAHRLVVDLERAGRIDGLTGVLNRRALENEGARAVELSIGMGLPAAVLLFDLDHFKRINDTHGHLAGDAALQHFATIVGRSLRGSDLFGRYGGEEFVAVLPGAGADDARAAAERLRALVTRSPAVFQDITIPLSVSIGLAWGEGADRVFESLVSRADAGLYRAKDSGRNRVIEAAAA